MTEYEAISAEEKKLILKTFKKAVKNYGGILSNKCFFTSVGTLSFNSLFEAPELVENPQNPTGKKIRDKFLVNLKGSPDHSKLSVNFGTKIAVEKTESTTLEFEQFKNFLCDVLKENGYPYYLQPKGILSGLEKDTYCFGDGDLSGKDFDLGKYIYSVKRRAKYAPDSEGRVYSGIDFYDVGGTPIYDNFEKYFYDGAYVRAKVAPKLWTFSEKIGVSLYLIAVQFIEEGERREKIDSKMDSYVKELNKA